MNAAFDVALRQGTAVYFTGVVGCAQPDNLGVESYWVGTGLTWHFGRGACDYGTWKADGSNWLLRPGCLPNPTVLE